MISPILPGHDSLEISTTSIMTQKVLITDAAMIWTEHMNNTLFYLLPDVLPSLDPSEGSTPFSFRNAYLSARSRFL